MPSSVTVNFLTTQHKASTGVTAAFPDVCKTPAPPAPVPPPIPYPNVGSSGMASGKVTKRVGDDTQKVVVKGSNYTMTSGDEPGVALGVVSSKIKGKSNVMNQSVNVKFEGKGIGRLSDPHGNNAGEQANAASPACAQPPNAGGEATTTEQEDACKALEKNKVPKEDVSQIAESNGMVGDHAEKIADYCGKEGVSATFRSGNPAQVKHLKGTDKINGGNPCPGKPMEIKNKSINPAKREKTVKNPDGSVDKDLQKKIADNDLEGLVGVYDENEKLTGVRNTTGFQSIDDIPPVKETPYAGDYDAHEFFGKDGKRIPADKKPTADEPGTSAESEMIAGLNKAIGRDGTEANPNMVMHGPQANYTEYCEETGQKPNPDLQKPDLSEKEPLLAFKDGDMYTLKTKTDLDNFYKCQGAEQPKEWN